MQILHGNKNEPFPRIRLAEDGTSSQYEILAFAHYLLRTPPVFHFSAAHSKINKEQRKFLLRQVTVGVTATKSVQTREDVHVTCV